MSKDIIDQANTASQGASNNQNAQEGTQVEVEVTAPHNSAEDAQEIVTIGDESRDEDPTKEDLERKALQGKTSALEKKANELERTRKSEIEVLDSVFRDDPRAYEKWRQNYKAKFNVDPGSHSDIYGTTTASQQNSSITDNPEIDIQKVVADQVNQVLTVERQKEESNQGFKEFIEAVPEMHPDRFQTDEERQRASDTWKNVATLAAAYKQVNPTMTSGQAFIAAYNALPENIERMREQERENGRYLGKANSMITGTASGNIAGGSSQTQKRTIKMTPNQKATYDRLMKSSPSVAKRFAESL